jgi:methionine-rich copper-binding protein CopC
MNNLFCRMMKFPRRFFARDLFNRHGSPLTIHGAAAALILLFHIALPAAALAHAFPLRADPRVGSTVAEPPAKVTIWFDSEIEGAFSKIEVYDAEKRRVDKNDPRVDAGRTRLEVDVAPLPPGKYQVHWTALSVDTHVTEGQFSFTIK